MLSLGELVDIGEGLCNCVCSTVELVPLVYTTVQYLVRLHKIATSKK
jgi:hypothetical protein